MGTLTNQAPFRKITRRASELPDPSVRFKRHFPDTSALLALIFDEPCGEDVRRLALKRGALPGYTQCRSLKDCSVYFSAFFDRALLRPDAVEHGFACSFESPPFLLRRGRSDRLYMPLAESQIV